MAGKNFSAPEGFVNPPSEYRGKPFWAWNGKLDEAELRRQLRVMKRMGLGGAFMHSRTGLSTEYLSDEWFKLVNACADECRKNSMEAWLYDEDRWPSGAAGGIVTKNPRYRMKALHVAAQRACDYKYSKDHLAIFAVELDGDEMKSFRRISRAEIKSIGDCTIVHCQVKPEEPSSWYNGQTYLDTMSEEAVDKFIEVTHKAYKKNCGAHFGKLMPGIFTDEPNYGHLGCSDGVSRLPWTDRLPQAFRRKYGYDILDFIPELVYRFKKSDFSKARHDYFETANLLFVRAFGKRIYDFCEKAGLLYTGHVLSEESLRSQTRAVGSAMRFYEYMQAPGIDILCGQVLEREGGRPPEYLTAKQCASVLNQMGRKWMLSELYGCTGWHFTLAEHKAVGDWQAAMGVNLRCQHLSWVTMKGEAKRDYPASISFQSPFWKDYGLVEDYFARVASMLSRGRPVIDIGVIHPIESAWGLAFQNPSGRYGWEFPQKDGKGERSPMALLDEKLESIQSTLLEGHFDFEYIDEEILARHGAASKGRLKVGKSSYSTIIVPPLATMRAGTAETLAKFAARGGNLIFVESLPERLDAEESDRIANLFPRAEIVRLSKDAIIAAILEDKGARRVSIRTSSGEEYAKSVYTMRKDAGGRAIVFICSTTQKAETVPLDVEIPFVGDVQEWDPQSGEVSLADFVRGTDSVRVKTSLSGCGSRLFVVDPKPDASPKKRPAAKESARIEIPADEFRILRDEANAFPLDYAEFSIAGGEFMPAEEILRIDTIAREKAGWPRQGGQMAQPWTYEKKKNPKTVPVRLRYRFIADEVPSSPSSLVMEAPERFSISLNGYELRHDGGEGYWIDNSFKKLNVPAHVLRNGENMLELSTDYAKDDALEALYFTGEFGVEWRRTASCKAPLAAICALPEKLRAGDWCEQGFPAYTGSITYLAEVEIGDTAPRYFLQVPEWAGSLLKIHVNGKLAGRIAWSPFEVEIGDCLQKGVNRIGIEVVGTRRNILGPLHNKTKYPTWTGPGQFRDENSWTDDYVRLPYGLFAKPFISVRN